LALALALGAAPVAARAQCPDGTLPPCEIRQAQAVHRVAAPAADRRGRSFLVLPFRNLTNSPDQAWLVEGATTILGDALGQWEEISVVSAERLYPALRRHGLEPGQVLDEARVRRVAEETGGWTAVTGEVLATGRRVRLSARAYDVVSNRVLVRVTEDALGADEIVPSFERMARRLLATAGLEARDVDPSGATTRSLDAYRAYLRGLGYYHRSEMRQAREAFEEALRFDSTFAQAHLKLAEASMTTVESIVDPASPAYRHAERAAALSQRLPPRDRELVQALASLFRGQVGAARERLQRVLAADSNDLEALDNLADIAQLDPVLVQTPAGERPRGSLNEAVRLAKRALALDPGRHQNYETLSGVYLIAAGEGSGRVAGIRGEPSSLLDLFQAMALRPARIFVAVLRDTIELVPADSLDRLNPDSLRAAQARAAAVAVEWADRWVATTPDAAAANLIDSRANEMAGRYAIALRRLAVAESLGLQVEALQNLPGRRVQILVRAGETARAMALADSLRAANYIETAPGAMAQTIRTQDLAWFFTAYLLGGRFASADSLTTYLIDLTRQAAPQLTATQVTGAVLNFLALRADPRQPPTIPAIPEAIRYAAADSLAAGAGRLPRSAVLARELAGVMTRSITLAPERTVLERTHRWRSLAEARLAEGKADAAFGLTMPSVNLDSSAEGREQTFDLLRRITAAFPEAWEAHYQIGKLGALSGRHLDEAEAALRRYLQHEPVGAEPGRASALWRLGMVLERKGDVPGARASYQEALRVDPQNAEARAALARLGER
jgi:tetratricopeptide (TPR) repeat protein/TolB-like protein